MRFCSSCEEPIDESAIAIQPRISFTHEQVWDKQKGLVINFCSPCWDEFVDSTPMHLLDVMFNAERTPLSADH